MIRLLTFILLLLHVTLLRPAHTAPLSDPAAIQQALDQASPGTEIVLAGGTYPNLRLTLASSGNTTQPVILRPATPGEAVLTGTPQLRITGSHIEVRGLAFRDCVATTGTKGLVLFDGASSSRLTSCTFENNSLGGIALVSFRNAARQNRVDHCRFRNTRYRCVTVVVDDSSLKIGPPTRNRIDHCLFQDVPPLGRNGAETLQIGQRAIPHSDLRTSTVVEANIFDRCNGEAEIISVKTTGNVIRNNLFRQCEGELVMRHGHENVAEGNCFDGGTGGIRLAGHGHRILGNTMIRCRETGIRLYYGTPDTRHPASYLPVYDCLISGNVILDCAQAGILVGDMRNARFENAKWAGPPWYASAVMECTVAPHDNLIEQNLVTGTEGTQIQCIEAPKNTLRENNLQLTNSRFGS